MAEMYRPQNDFKYISCHMKGCELWPGGQYCIFLSVINPGDLIIFSRVI